MLIMASYATVTAWTDGGAEGLTVPVAFNCSREFDMVEFLSGSFEIECR